MEKPAGEAFKASDREPTTPEQFAAWLGHGFKVEKKSLWDNWIITRPDGQKAEITSNLHWDLSWLEVTLT